MLLLVEDMAEIRLRIPEGLKEELPEDWSEVALEAIKLKAFELELKKSRRLRQLLFKSLVSKSKLKEKDALELGSKINEAMFKDLKTKGLV